MRGRLECMECSGLSSMILTFRLMLILFSRGEESI